jgi:hypothetical protein
MKAPRINWKRRGEDLLVLAMSLGFFVSIGGILFVLREALVGELWALWALGAVAACIVVATIWAWLVQDDFGDRA